MGRPFRTVSLFKRLPINEQLNEHAFSDGINEIEAAANALSETFLCMLEK